MNSSQSVLQRYTGKSFDFNTTDAKSICKEINQLSIEWAVEKILAKSPKTITRYQTKGKFIIMQFQIFYCQLTYQYLEFRRIYNKRKSIKKSIIKKL